ncbi:MAG: ArnT family glycosyltransferase [Janthinobacterium lividum]
MFNSSNGLPDAPCRPTRTLVVVLGTAFFLRVALILSVLSHLGPAWFFSRGSEMGFLADSLIHGHGLSSPFGVPTGPTAIVAPGYPLFTALVFRVLGSYTWPAALCLMLLNAGCNTATVYLIYRLARALADGRTATLAAMFWAYSLPLLWMPTIFWETSLSCLLMLGVVGYMFAIRQRRSLRFWFAYGALCGLAGLFNPALLPCFLLLAAYTLWRTSSPAIRSRSVAYLVGVVLVYAPWPIRNARVFHALVLTRSTVGLELWMGNHPGSNGFLDALHFPTYNGAELADYRQRGELGYTAHKQQLAHAFIRAYPARFVLLSGQRSLRFWTGAGTQGGSLFFRLHATLSSCLAVCGFLLLWRRGHRSLCCSVGMVLLVFPLPYYITHAEFRYRLVLDPLLCALAAPALQAMLVRLRAAPDLVAAQQATSLIPNAAR